MRKEKMLMDYNNNKLESGDRVRSIYARAEPENIGTITKDGYIIYDDEPETEYQILDSRYLIKIDNQRKNYEKRMYN